MGWSAASFKAARPEFAPVADARVEAALQDAERLCDVRLFRADHDAAVSARAAHILAVSPHGMQARMEPAADGKTTYLAEWERLARARAGGPWAVGQRP